jgi:YaiO family outer membrane protein
VDAYRTLWKNAYGNVRAQVAPDATVIPETDIGIEIFQGIGRGWEGSVGARRMAFTATTVSIGALSLGRFVGPWFLRGRVTQPFSEGADESTASVSGLLRRQLDERQGFVEISAGTGGEAVTTAVSSVEVRSTSFVSAGAQKYFTRTFGTSISASVVNFQGIPRRTAGVISVLSRW